jgi:hypothetical protein
MRHTQMHAHEVHAHDMHACEMNAHEMHTCTPIKYRLMRHMPVRCTPMRHAHEVYLMRCTPIRHTPHEMSYAEFSIQSFVLPRRRTPKSPK